ncbi:MAG: phospholipase C [Acidimicrobiales bacterium]
MRTKRKAAASAAALATAAAFIAPMAVGITAAGASGTSTPIQHLVVIFQENVSFDHYFGTYPNATNADGTPFTPKAGTPAVNGLSGTLLTANPNGTNPARYANTEAAVTGQQSLLSCDQDHNYTDEQTAFDGGAMDKFVTSVGSTSKDEVTGVACSAGEVMNYYDGNSVTGMWNYAQQFSMSDNSYGTTFGPSAPGAVNLVSGDTGNVDTTGCTTPNSTAGCTHMVGSVSFASNTAPNADLTADGSGGYSLTSDAQGYYDDCSTRDAVALTGANVGDELTQAGASWGWFQGGFRPSAPYATAEAAQATPHATNVFVPDEFSGKFNATIPNATALGGGTSPLNQGICNSFHDIGADLPTPNTGTGQWGSKGDYIAHHEPFEYYASTANPHHIPPTSIAAIGTDTQTYSGGTYLSGSPQWNTANHQYDMSDFDSLVSAAAQGQTDASSSDGKYHLPAVSFLKAAGYEDGHAQYSDPIDEQNFVTREINALMQTPDWSSTAVVISYDDSDGWYDHAFASSATGGTLVPLNPSGTAADNLLNSVLKPYPTTGVSQKCFNATAGQATSTALAGEQGRCGLGPRLPLLAISCFARSNYVDHAVSDQSSITKFIEGNWGLAPISGSFATLAYNGAASVASYNAEGPLSNLFDFSSGATDTAGCNPYYLDVHSGAPTTVPNPVLPDSRTPALFALSGLTVIVGFVAVRRRARRRSA